MSLVITRYAGQSFTLTWPGGAERVVTVESIGNFFMMISVNHGPATMVARGSYHTIGVPSHPAVAQLTLAAKVCQGIVIDAPREIRVLRDDAICREAKS